MASPLASAVVVSARSATSVVPAPASCATALRWSPGWLAAAPLAALPVIAFLALGSQPRTLTVFTCWTPETRGLKLIRVSCHVRSTVDPSLVSALLKTSLLSSTEQRKPLSRARRAISSQSVSALCWKNSWTTLVDCASAESPASPATFLTMSEADTCWKVLTLRSRWSVWALSRPRMTISAPFLPKSGSSETTWPLKIRTFAVSDGGLTLISRSLPIPNAVSASSTISPVGSPIRRIAESGRASVSRTRTSTSASRNLGSTSRAVDHHGDARDVLLRAGGGRHQPSTLGRLSARPRRRWSGFSIPLASAIARHVVASP